MADSYQVLMDLNKGEIIEIPVENPINFTNETIVKLKRIIPMSGCFAFVKLVGFSTGISIISPFSSSINT